MESKTPATAPETEAAPLDFNSLISEIVETEKQTFPNHEEKEPINEHPPEQGPTDSAEQPTAPPAGQSFRKVGESYFTILNVPLETFAAYIGGEKPEKYAIEPGNKEMIINAFADLAEQGGWTKPPPWMVVSMLVVFSYSAVMMAAFKDRSSKKALKEHQAAQKKKAAAVPLDEIIKNGPPYILDCPGCGEPMNYQNVSSLKQAAENKTKCAQCRGNISRNPALKID